MPTKNVCNNPTNQIESKPIYPCPFVCLSIRMKIQISEAMRSTNTNKNIKRGKYASFDMPLISYSCRFLFPLIVPILVFFNGAEFNGIVIVKYFKSLSLQLRRYKYIQSQNWSSYKHFISEKFFLLLLTSLF